MGDQRVGLAGKGSAMVEFECIPGLLATAGEDGRSMWDAFVGSFRRAADSGGIGGRLPGWVWAVLLAGVMVGLSLLLSRWMGGSRKRG